VASQILNGIRPLPVGVVGRWTQTACATLPGVLMVGIKVPQLDHHGGAEKLATLLRDPYSTGEVINAQAGWRPVCASAVTQGMPIPARNSALTYFDGYRSARLPANLQQAQRDFFGAHTSERSDKPRGEFFHTNWTGRGGTTSSSTYNV